MSVIRYSKSDLSNIAKSLYREFGEMIFSYEERQVSEQEADHHRRLKAGHDNSLSILLDNYRWTWEKIHLSNQMEWIYEYGKYGVTYEIKREDIDEIGQSPEISKAQLNAELRSIRRNSEQFLENSIKEKLDRWIDLVSVQVLREIEN